ncbi:MAG: hypothetical protein I8H75_02070 [Myxococcaceae bacterium]|nr:hypothetical protein [Myxococcaceae bacterium]MBH2006122.1 hypothetical protein [Myxococcaceae bacterium]
MIRKIFTLSFAFSLLVPSVSFAARKNENPNGFLKGAWATATLAWSILRGTGLAQHQTRFNQLLQTVQREGPTTSLREQFRQAVALYEAYLLRHHGNREAPGLRDVEQRIALIQRNLDSFATPQRAASRLGMSPERTTRVLEQLGPESSPQGLGRILEGVSDVLELRVITGDRNRKLFRVHSKDNSPESEELAQRINDALQGKNRLAPPPVN